MNSITAIFEALCAATGRKLIRPGHAKLYRCVFHDDSTASLSLREAYASFKCFGCGVKGGRLDAPVAFEVARDHTEASRWLSDRNLIPPPDAALGSGDRVATFQVDRLYTVSDNLSLYQRAFRLGRLIDLYEQVGAVRYRVVRDQIAERRAVQDRENAAAARKLFQLFACALVAKECGHIEWGPTLEDIAEAERRYPMLFTKTGGAA